MSQSTSISISILWCSIRWKQRKCNCCWCHVCGRSDMALSANTDCLCFCFVDNCCLCARNLSIVFWPSHSVFPSDMFVCLFFFVAHAPAQGLGRWVRGNAKASLGIRSTTNRWEIHCQTRLLTARLTRVALRTAQTSPLTLTLQSGQFSGAHFLN